MSMYWEYLKEREGVEVLEHEHGFATVRLESPELLYLQDIYVKPEHRKQGVGRELLSMVEDLGRTLGCKYVQGTVLPAANGSTDSLKALLATGFQLSHSDNYMIFLVKEI